MPIQAELCNAYAENMAEICGEFNLTPPWSGENEVVKFGGKTLTLKKSCFTFDPPQIMRPAFADVWNTMKKKASVGLWLDKRDKENAIRAVRAMAKELGMKFNGRRGRKKTKK